MEFDNNNNNIDISNKIDNMSILKDDDSPQQQINEQSLTEDLEKNRESLKRKLQTRRSLKQLVEVGIMPPPKAPLPFFEQRKQLQMRKTQDMLKHKIISRPDRQLLIEHNILSDTTAAPAIQKTQRQLKRARLADNLNDKLAARPGVLELVANNILETDPTVKEAIQGGLVQFPSTKTNGTTPVFTTSVYNSIDYQQQQQQQQQQQRPLRPKISSSSNTTNGQTSSSSSSSTTTTTRRTLGSTPKAKSSLTFHEYKGPSQKVEVTKVPLQPTPSLIVQPVQATLVPIVPLQHDDTLNDNHYRIQLQQQQLFLELLRNNNTNSSDDQQQQQNDDSNLNLDVNPIGNLLQQPIDDNVNLLTTIHDDIQAFEKMKLVDLKNECRKLNLSTTGTKMKLIEKLRNAKVKMSDTTINNTETSAAQMTNPSTPSVRLLISTSSLTNQELYQQQQQKIDELNNQLQKLRQLDSNALQSLHLIQQIDTNTTTTTATIPPKCDPILSVQLKKRILMQQQEKLKQKIQDEQQQQQQQQQHSIVPLTPESVARFLANQTQSQTADNHPWSIHHSISAPTFPTYAQNNYYHTSQSVNHETKLVDDDAILSLLDDYTDSSSTIPLAPDDSLSNPINSYVSSSPSTHMDWLPMTSPPTIVNDFYDDNNPDFTQFLNQFGNDHHLLFDSQLTTTCQQQNTISFDLLSPSSPMI